MKKVFIYFLVALFLPVFSRGTHIVGGELFYQCLGGNNYRITFKLYRDGCPTCYIFDHPSSFYIFYGNGNLYKQITFDITDSINVPPIINNPCLVAPPDVIVWGIEIDTVVYLPPGSDYNVVYQRCCRNNTIVNLLDPGGTGSTYMEHIPDPATLCNSSPYFNVFPPIAICVGDSLRFDHSATDPDGDSLVYDLCTPYLGADQFDPMPTPPMPPPYNFVSYISPYSSGYPIDASPPLAVDPVTGKLSGIPTTTGQYVVAVCVKEYRNGQLIGEHKRDFQFNIVECGSQVVAAMPNYVTECDDYTVNFQNQSQDATYYYWNFGDGTTSTSATPTHTYPDTGIYYVTMMANPGWPCADTAYATVRVFPGLVPDFGFYSECAGKPIQFTDSSTTLYGNIISWNWLFGDGFSSSLQDPAHTYLTGGTYSVKLTVTNTKYCTKFITRNIVIYPLPYNSFTATTPCKGDTTFFTNTTTLASGSVIFWSWSFGSEASSNEQHPWYIFPDTGQYIVNLVSFTNNGCSDTFQKIISVQPVPVSAAGPDRVICSFDTIRIGDLPASGYTYSWYPQTGIMNPDSSQPLLTLSNDSNIKLPYEYFVTTELNGCTSKDSVLIEVYPDIRAAIPHQPGQCLYGNSFDFTAAGVFGTGATFNWNFGPNSNPSFSPFENPSSVQFITEGEHVVTLLITDNGCTSNDTDTVQIYTVPVAGFTLSEKEGCNPLTVYFTDESIAQSALSYLWDFGDGKADTSKNPVHIFSPEGIYNVTLTIELEQCKGFQSMIASAPVTVRPLPVAGFTAEPKEISYFNPYINFTDKSSGALSCLLLFGDGTSSYECTATHEYTDTGNFIIMQIVENVFGCTDTAIDRIRILPEYTFFAPRAFTPNEDGINDIYFTKGIGIAKFELWIFDRWGDNIYYTDNMNTGWDGRVNNGKKPAQQDVYVWIVKITDVFEEKHRYMGRVTLVK
ncbi:MAG: PKD domain-containing protein [Bacteroidetes bacterium]|nr:PKD domain-containing protein [Bacteroidota bacterium]